MGSVIGVYLQDVLADGLIFAGALCRFGIKMLVISDAIYSENSAESLDIIPVMQFGA